MPGQTLIPIDEASANALIDLLHRSRNCPPSSELPADNDAHDEILVPLTVAGDLIGYLVLERIGPDRFTPEDNEIIKTFANQAAVAITNAQLYMAQREEAWVSTALLQVAEATARATTLDRSAEHRRPHHPAAGRRGMERRAAGRRTATPSAWSKSPGSIPTLARR